MKENSKTHLAVHSKKEIQLICIDSISYCQANDNYTFIFCGNERKVIYKPLKIIQLHLESFGFFRTSRSYIVNMSKIVCIKNGRKTFAILNDDSKVPVSSDKKTELLEKLNYKSKIVY